MSKSPYTTEASTAVSSWRWICLGDREFPNTQSPATSVALQVTRHPFSISLEHFVNRLCVGLYYLTTRCLWKDVCFSQLGKLKRKAKESAADEGILAALSHLVVGGKLAFICSHDSHGFPCAMTTLLWAAPPDGVALGINFPTQTWVWWYCLWSQHEGGWGKRNWGLGSAWGA